MLGTLVIVEDEAEAVGRALPSDRLLERIRDQLLGHAPRHRPAHDLPMERVDHGCEAGPSFARPDATDPPLLRRPQGAERLQRPEDDASQDREGVEQGAQRRPGADRRDRQLQQARLVEAQRGPRVVRPHSGPSAQGKADPGCPYCSGREVLAGYNDLATTHPGIAAMWHPRMNKRLNPTGVQAVSRKPAWWRGECGRVYQMAVRDRVRAKPGYCPYCSGRKRPERPIRLD